MELQSDFPLVSYIIPTFNADEYLERCLESIFQQEYPNNRYEVFIADGGSSDKTLEIAKRFNTIILQNEKRFTEYGKKIAFDKSKGTIIALLDSDNIIGSTDWLKRMIKPLMIDETIVGVESNYLLAADFTSLNSYANLLVIVDPVARLLASKPISTETLNGYIVKEFEIRATPISGANGFLWRRIAILKYNKYADRIGESFLLMEIAKYQKVRIANIPKLGVYHYYCKNLGDYYNKRKKVARQHLNRRLELDDTWVDNKGDFKLTVTALYLLTVLGPLIEACIQLFKSKNLNWLWHPIVSLLSIILYLVYFVHSLIKLPSSSKARL